MNLPEYKAEKFQGDEKIPVLYLVSFVGSQNSNPNIRALGTNFQTHDLDDANDYLDNQIEEANHGGTEIWLGSYLWFSWTLTRYDPTSSEVVVLRNYSKVRNTKRTIIKPVPKTKKVLFDDYNNVTFPQNGLEQFLSTNTTHGQNEL